MMVRFQVRRPKKTSTRHNTRIAADALIQCFRLNVLCGISLFYHAKTYRIKHSGAENYQIDNSSEQLKTLSFIIPRPTTSQKSHCIAFHNSIMFANANGE